MEGFWTVQFQGVQGMGAGVLTLIGGILFGGDSSFLYDGIYTIDADKVTAQVKVSRHSAGTYSVMGRDTFSLSLEGTADVALARLAGSVPGTPLRLNALLTKRGDLPKK